MVETICCKTNTVVAFVLSFIFISRKIHYTQIIGLACIILAYVMISTSDQKKENQSNAPENIIMLTISSLSEGLAFFNFDYFIVENVIDFFHYAFLTQSFNLFFNIGEIAYRTWTKELILFKYCTDFKYYLLIASYTGISILWFVLSFTYDLVPRMLISAFLYTLSDFISQGMTNNRQYHNIKWYLLCLAGILIYEAKVIYKYFTEKPKETEEQL